MSKIEKALLKATGAKPQKSGEDRQKFLLRLMMAVQGLPSDENDENYKEGKGTWEGIGAITGAQEWYNAAIDADNENPPKPVPDFSDAKPAEDEPEDEPETDGDAADSEVEDEAVSTSARPKGKKKDDKAAGKKPAAKKAEAKPEAKKKAEPAAKPAAAKAPKKGTSMRRALKMIVVKKPKITTDDLIEQLEKKGFKSPSKLTVTSIRADTRDTMKVLAEAGLLDIEV